MSVISIVIPIYNVEPYLKKCLDSVAFQSYINLEIICVNDGSTDNSGKICDEYALKDKRIKVIHKQNGGNASAINAGLNVITGKYVGFVDPDDWIEKDYYEHAYNIIENNEVDIVCFSWFKNKGGLSTKVENKKPIKKDRLNRDQILLYTFARDLYSAFCAYRWNKLFNSVLFKSVENGGYCIRAREDIKVGSDVLFFVECAMKTKSALFCEDAYYHYEIRENSLFHSKDIEKKKGSLKSYGLAIKLLETNGVSSEITRWVKRFYSYHSSLLAELAIELNDASNLLFMQNEIKRYIQEYVETNQNHPDRIERIYRLLEANC